MKGNQIRVIREIRGFKMTMATLPVPETVTLSDGTTVTLRPIRADDAERLQALHARLSPETIYLRFLDLKAKVCRPFAVR